MRTIHVYRAAREYFIDGIYWGDDAEGVRFYLQVTGVPPEEITKALEQVEQEGTYTVVCPAKAGVFSRRQTYQGKSQSPGARSAGGRETNSLKPLDSPICGMGASVQAVA